MKSLAQIKELRETKPRRITYPSGLMVSRHKYHNPSETISIQIERIVSGLVEAYHDGSLKVGSWSVSGSMLVDGDSFENLSSRDFRTKGAAKAFALGMFRKFEPMTHATAPIGGGR